MKKIRIFLIEDNRILTDGLSKLAERQSDIVLAGTACSGDANVAASVRKAKAQVVLIGSSSLDISGPDLARMLKRTVSELKLIGMGLSEDGTEIAEFVKAGATGFILKDAGAQEVLDTIRWVAREEKVILPVLPPAFFPGPETETHLPADDGQGAGAIQLTKREQEIVRLIAHSSSNKEIARRLNIAIFTVKSHVHNILVRLGLHSRLQIATYALVSKPWEMRMMLPGLQGYLPVPVMDTVKGRSFAGRNKEAIRSRRRAGFAVTEADGRNAA